MSFFNHIDIFTLFTHSIYCFYLISLFFLFLTSNKQLLDEQQIDLERKEKLVKLQVFEVKRLKRQLKDLVHSSKPVNLPNEYPIVPTRPSNSNTKGSRTAPSRKSKTQKQKVPHMSKSTLPPSMDDDGNGNQAWTGVDDDTAATRVQTSYRGLKSRRKVTALKKEKEEMHYGA